MTDAPAQVREATDLKSLVSRYVELKRAGKRWVGLCPFHREKTPSFGVHQDGYWKCFGCDDGGSCFDFLMKIEGIGFGEALRRLADEAGISLDGKARSIPVKAAGNELGAECRWYWQGVRGRLNQRAYELMDLVHRAERYMMNGGKDEAKIEKACLVAFTLEDIALDLWKDIDMIRDADTSVLLDIYMRRPSVRPEMLECLQVDEALLRGAV